MRMTEVTFDGRLPVDGYGPGFFRLGGRVVRGACTILPAGIAPWEGYDDRAALLEAAGAVDVLFVGTGAEMRPLPPAFRAALEGAGIGVEFMATPAACRSYNVLLSEGRRIGLALIPV